MRKAESCAPAQRRSSGTDAGAPRKAPCLPEGFLLSRSLTWRWEVAFQSPASFPNRQKEVLETGEKTVSMNLHFQSASGEDSQMVLLPLLAGYTGLQRLIFGSSHAGRTQFCFH